jgi:GDP-L-fucose synthase
MILVTGASGVIGTALVAELKRNAADEVFGIRFSDVDLCDLGQTVAAFKSWKPEIVYHLAARVYGLMGNQAHKAASFRDNILINTNVIEASRLSGTRKIVAMGSTAAYSDATPLPMREDDIWIGPPHSSEAAYGHAKRAMLVQLEAYYEDYGLDFAYCISTNLFGPGDRFDEKYGHVIPSLVSKIHRAKKSGTPLTVWGSGKPQRDFLYAKDAARAMRLIGEAHHGAINLATANTCSIAEMVSCLAEVADFRGDIVWDSHKPDGQLARQYDVSRLRSLGFAPQYSLKDALRETYQWYGANYPNVRR